MANALREARYSQLRLSTSRFSRAASRLSDPIDPSCFSWVTVTLRPHCLPLPEAGSCHFLLPSSSSPLPFLPSDHFNQFNAPPPPRLNNFSCSHNVTALTSSSSPVFVPKSTFFATAASSAKASSTLSQPAIHLPA